jgi:hypothetical protein
MISQPANQSDLSRWKVINWESKHKLSFISHANSQLRIEILVNWKAWWQLHKENIVRNLSLKMWECQIQLRKDHQDNEMTRWKIVPQWTSMFNISLYMLREKSIMKRKIELEIILSSFLNRIINIIKRKVLLKIFTYVNILKEISNSLHQCLVKRFKNKEVDWRNFTKHTFI